LAQAFDNMRESLHKIIARIRDASLHMQASTDEIFMAINQLTAALEQQSASVHETTMTMESLTTTSRQISGNTATVVKMAEQTKQPVSKRHGSRRNDDPENARHPCH